MIDVTDHMEDTWFDRAGNYHSDALKVTERYSAVDANTLQYQATIEDPKVFSRPWKISMPLYRRRDPNMQLMEYKCVEFAEEADVRAPAKEVRPSADLQRITGRSGVQGGARPANRAGSPPSFVLDATCPAASRPVAGRALPSLISLISLCSPTARRTPVVLSSLHDDVLLAMVHVSHHPVSLRPVGSFASL